MTKHTVLDHANDRAFVCANHDKADERASGIKMMIDNPSEVEVVSGAYESYEDYEPDTEDVDAEVIDMTDNETPPDPGTPAAKAADPREGSPVEPETKDSKDERTRFLENPIRELRKVDSAYVNTIHGNDAISKRGFRYIQSKFEISTTAEVVATFDDPLGVAVHARAELPDGRYAEAHGEAYRGSIDRKPDAHEFVRYADTRAKNRALSDLTSAGALAESELDDE